MKAKFAHPTRVRADVFCVATWLLSVALLLGTTPDGLAAASNPNSIVNSKHNLSTSGTGDIHSATEGDVCIFCHAPHATTGQIPLWNHRLPATTYTPYSSSTLRATVGQPTGSSRLCLSCHDGTVALGMVANRRAAIPMQNGSLTMPAGSSRFGTDLSGHHPVSFTYDSALATAQGELRDPTTLQQRVRLDKDRQLQCTACHDPHNNQYGQFLVEDNTASTLCLECHLPSQWAASAHATSRATWNGSGRNPWPHTSGTTVAANGCENCHAPHGAGTKPHLLNFSKAEDNCLVCHNGSVASKNLASEFNKLSAHSLNGMTAARDAAQTSFPVTDEQVSCVDCHNPHAARTGSTGTSLSGSLTQVKGVTAAGGVVNTASYEYEICFRCHASSAAVVSSEPRQFTQPNTRLQFAPANASYHPVLANAKSTRDPTLLSPWTTARQMLCTDCHNNDQGPGANGSGPNGPHGSHYAPLLERNLVRTDFQPESANTYALCYKCHARDSILSDQGFHAVNSLGQDRGHRFHVVEVKAACTTCHDAHGVQTARNLINFNLTYVTPGSNGRIEYVSAGQGSGNCSLTCHGKDHAATAYPTPQYGPSALGARALRR